MPKNTTRHELRAWLARAGWDHGQAASYLGVSRAQVSHLVNGTRRPSLDLAVRIQRMTGIKATAWAKAEQKEAVA